MVLVFLGIFGLIVDLNFVAVVHRHPGLAGLERDTHEDAGIVVVVAHLVDHPNAAIAKFFTAPIEQAHSAMCADEAVLDGVVAGADMLPPG